MYKYKNEKEKKIKKLNTIKKYKKLTNTKR